MVSAVFHYLGPAFAVLLLPRIDVLGVAWLRIATAAVIFALWRRPWRTWTLLDRPTRQLLLAWAVVLALMNSCFYLAIERLPLGTVAALEFLPVIVLVAVAARNPAQRRGPAAGSHRRVPADRHPADPGAGGSRMRGSQRGAVRDVHRAWGTRWRALGRCRASTGWPWPC